MKFSLILATYGEDKVPLIIRFLQSLSKQSYNGFELIIVDQNSNNKIREVVNNNTWPFEIKYLKSSIGLSKARNVGLKFAKNEILAFPDDDCYYPENLLSKVIDFFRSNIKYDVLCVDTKDINTLEKLPYTKKISGTKRILKGEIFKTVTSISLFCKKEHNVKFDEKFGLGAIYQSCEEFDYVMNLMKLGKEACFTDSIYVLHPNHCGQSKKNQLKKVKKHSVGHGAFFRKHYKNLIKTSIYYLLISPLGGIIFYSLICDYFKVKIYYSYLFYRIKGFIAYKNNLNFT